MTILWILWLAVIFKCSQAEILTSTAPDLLQPNSKLITLPTEQALTSSNDILKPARDKRGTGPLIAQLLTANELATGGNQVSQIDKVKRNQRNFIDSPRVRFSSWAGKRAKFSSWGGKRADQDPELFGIYDDENDMQEEKRAKFSSWGGKRGDMDGENEGAIDWAGNSLTDLGAEKEPREEKRAKFSSWAGKRDEDRRKFYSWAGKRADDSISDFNDIVEEKRAKFSSWGGKRSNDIEDGTDYDENNLVEEKRKLPWIYGDNQAKFWDGKRNDWWSNKRARFNSWGGKRNVNITTGGINDLVDHDDDGIYKRSLMSYTPLSWKRKPVFSSWGGKRTARSAQPQRRLILPSNLFRERSTWGSLLRPIRRGPDFYAWGGKRST